MTNETQRATLLASLNARLAGIENSGDPDVAATPEALDELVRLCAQVDPESDVETAQTAGLMYFYRSHAVPDLDEGARCYIEALSLLRVVYRTGRGGIPDLVAEAFRRNPALLAGDWHGALAEDAHKLIRSHIDDPVGLSIAIAMQRKAAAMLPDSSPLRLEYSSNLGLYLRLRHELTNSATDVREALDIARSCLTHPGTSDSQRASLLFNVSLAYRDLYRLTGANEDVDGWLRYAREAQQTVEARSANRRTVVDNLVKALRAKHRDTLNDCLDEIIDITRREAAIDAEPSDLPAALIARYRFRGALKDIDEAISLLRRILDFGDPADAERPGCLSNLGTALMMRYDARGIESDLEEGFDACRQALQIAREDDPERPMYSSNLGLLALTRAGRNRWTDDDLQLAIRAARAAVDATPSTDPRYAGYASNLAQALLAGLQGAEPRRVDLDEAIALSKEAADRGRGLDLAGLFEANVASAELRRHQVTGSQSDLDDAIARYREALPMLPAEMPARADALLALSGALIARNAAGDLDACVEVSREAARTASASLSTRFYAANKWALAADMRADWKVASKAYSEAIQLLTCIASGPLSRRDQEYALASAAGLSSRAAAAHLQAGDIEGAVEAFEYGHGVLLARELGTRGELRALAKAHPDLAKEYQKARERLLALGNQNVPALVSPATGAAALPRRPAAIGRERADLLKRLDSLLGTIRALEGFRTFQSAAPVRELYAAAADCPVVLFSVSTVRCDALIVTSDGVDVVPLPQVSPQQVQHQALLLWGAIDDAQQDVLGLGTPVFAEHVIDRVLTWLWDAVVEPVVAAIGITGRPEAGADLPRICWCPSGFLSLLPLHAAGHHLTRADAVPLTVMDRAVSSYTPTLQTLLSPPPTGTGTKPCELLVVAMPSTPGAQDLPGASVEARFLGSLFGERARLLGAVDGRPQATVEGVLEALPASRWAHFACHALSDLKTPSSSGLLLGDGLDHPLSIMDLMEMDLEGVELAFLSACATARPAPVLIEEVVHLASAFRVAGFPHVVATLWPVGDRSGAYICEYFYRGLAERENSITAAAGALHAAVRQLRDLVPDKPSKWAAHVHVGPC